MGMEGFPIQRLATSMITGSTLTDQATSCKGDAAARWRAGPPAVAVARAPGRWSPPCEGGVGGVYPLGRGPEPGRMHPLLPPLRTGGTEAQWSWDTTAGAARPREAPDLDPRNRRPPPRPAPLPPDPGDPGEVWISRCRRGVTSGGARAPGRASRAGGRRPAAGPRPAAPDDLRGPRPDVRQARAAPEHPARPAPRGVHDRAGRPPRRSPAVPVRRGRGDPGRGVRAAAGGGLRRDR